MWQARTTSIRRKITQYKYKKKQLKCKSSKSWNNK